MQTQLHVSLLFHTPAPELAAACAAKLCYSKSGAATLKENLTPQKAQEFLEKIVSLGHFSTIEHATFTFAIEGVSRTLTHQLVRHRLASYSQQSQRYVDAQDFDYIIPPSIAQDPKAKEQFIEAMQQAANAYQKLRTTLTQYHQDRLKQEGEDEKSAFAKAEKMANEDARFVLPGACETKILVTMNARELHHFFRQRCCMRAQWEIRQLANEMLRLAKQAAPALFQNCGPACVNGPCPEGKMSCKQAARMREFYQNLR